METLITIPFSPHLSKNRTHMVGKGGNIYNNPESEKIRGNVIEKLKEYRGQYKEGKIWIDILVRKPNERSDATNVIDLMMDAVQDGIGINDRWFSVKCDWVIDAKTPQVKVRIRQ